MNDQNLKKLKEELKTEGALEKEADELSLLSKNLSNLYSFERNNQLKIKFLSQVINQNFFNKKRLFKALFLSLMLVIGFSSVVGAQNSVPGDSLYPVKIASENIFSFINPSFKNQIIKRRSYEVKDLSSKNSTTQFHQAVKNYEDELNKSKEIDKKNIEESRKTLEEARANSLNENKQDLENVILQTKEIEDELKQEEVESENTGPFLDNDNKRNNIPNFFEK